MSSDGATSRVEHFSDYMRARLAQSIELVGHPDELWAGDPPANKGWFNDLYITESSALVVGDTQLISVEKSLGREIERVDLLVKAPSLGPVTSIGRGASNGEVILYSMSTGRSVMHRVGQPLNATTVLEPALLNVHAIGQDRIIASGLFEQEIGRLYAVAGEGSTSSAPVGEVRGRFGMALFPGLVRFLSRQLNMAAAVPSPDGTRLAVAHRWSDRINVYGTTTLRLDRSIAGPRETKLDFAVADVRGQDVFTLSPESTYSYVDVTATDEAIIALYSGREMRRYPSQFGLASELHVFTWDGRFKGAWRLAEPVQKIRIDPDTRALYCLRWAPRPSIVRYDARALFRDDGVVLAKHGSEPTRPPQTTFNR